MKLAIMQPYFFPYIGYLQLINAVDKYIFYDNLNFIKDAWVNRNNILLKNSGSLMINVPLVHKSSFVKIGDIEIDDTENWRRKLKKTIYFNYHQSTMFDEVYPILEQAIDYPTIKLSELNINIITSLCKYLNINTQVECNSSKYQKIEDLLIDEKYMSENYRGIDKKVVRIFEICKKEQANVFINAIGGTKLYSKDLFAAHNIQLYFIKMLDLKYEQYKNAFIPNMSIIDVMMFNSIEKIQELLCEYELI